LEILSVKLNKESLRALEKVAAGAILSAIPYCGCCPVLLSGDKNVEETPRR
jgi:hypothetical protein